MCIFLFAGTELFSRRSFGLFPLRTRHALVSTKPGLQRAVPLCKEPFGPKVDGRRRPEPGHPPGPGRELQIQSTLPHVGHGVSRGKDRLVPALQWRDLDT